MTRIGLISDTHMPHRWDKLPQIVFDRFADVDLILHAGDVGELWVLDQLGCCAPVIAVHGNDETAEATAALPYLQTIAVGGQRIVLTHAHYPDRKEELDSRKSDDWLPKLQRRADFAHQHQANIVVFGHTHIPMMTEFEGIWLINPGAIASANEVSRQRIQTIAIMTLDESPVPQVEWITLQGQPYIPQVNLNAGFIAALENVIEWIVEPKLRQSLLWLRSDVYPLAPDVIFDLIQNMARTRWFTDAPNITVKDVVESIQAQPDLPLLVLDKLRESEIFGVYL